jgi:hypothetical protein
MILPDEEIIEIAQKVAATHLAGLAIGKPGLAPSIDALDRDALEVAFFLTPGSSARVTGDMAVNTTFDLNQRLPGRRRTEIFRYQILKRIAVTNPRTGPCPIQSIYFNRQSD